VGLLDGCGIGGRMGGWVDGRMGGGRMGVARVCDLQQLKDVQRGKFPGKI